METPPPTGMLIGADRVLSAEMTPVVDKWSGALVGSVPRASRDDVRHAVQAAAAAFADRPLPPRQRHTLLQRVAQLVRAHEDMLCRLMIAETGFSWRDVQTEVARAVETLEWSAEEARRLSGEVIPIQGAPGFERAMAVAIRVPLGVVCAIAPFNSPLNTVCHKIAPALAAGNTVVLKPAGATPLTALRLADLFLDAGLPPGHLNVVTGSGGDVGRWLCEEQAIRFYTFTGSTAVGREIQSRIGLRRSCMELGAISCTIVCEDADVDRAIPLVINAAFRKAGQVCTSVQRLFVQQAVYEEVRERLVAATVRLKVGNPWEPETAVGPMISVDEAQRAADWVADTVARGATIAVGGKRMGALLWPTILVEVPDEARVACNEIFAPVLAVAPYAELDEVVARVNVLPYGLQAGIFTRDIHRAWHAARHLEVGGVIVNNTSSTRADLMPYGGTKLSGFGREGPRYAVEEMTDLRTIVFFDALPE